MTATSPRSRERPSASGSSRSARGAQPDTSRRRRQRRTPSSSSRRRAASGEFGRAAAPNSEAPVVRKSLSSRRRPSSASPRTSAAPSAIGGCSQSPSTPRRAAVPARASRGCPVSDSALPCRPAARAAARPSAARGWSRSTARPSGSPVEERGQPRAGRARRPVARRTRWPRRVRDRHDERLGEPAAASAAAE